MSITFDRRLLPLAGYQVLAALDLGRDAAAINGPRWLRPRWARDLERLVRQARAPERLAIQFAPLAFDTLEALASDPRGATSELWRAFNEAIHRVASRAERSLCKPKAAARLRRSAQGLSLPVARVRAELWPAGAPPLEVLDVPALGRRGRGWLRPDRHRVAVSLEEPEGHTLCQIAHELIHGVTDLEVRRRHAQVERDTRAGSAGAELHLALERRAMEVGEWVFARALPEQLDTYRAWCHSVAPSGIREPVGDSCMTK